MLKVLMKRDKTEETGSRNDHETEPKCPSHTYIFIQDIKTNFCHPNNFTNGGKMNETMKQNDDQLQDLSMNLEMNVSVLEDQIQYSSQGEIVWWYQE